MLHYKRKIYRDTVLTIKNPTHIYNTCLLDWNIFISIITALWVSFEFSKTYKWIMFVLIDLVLTTT